MQIRLVLLPLNGNKLINVVELLCNSFLANNSIRHGGCNREVQHNFSYKHDFT